MRDIQCYLVSALVLVGFFSASVPAQDPKAKPVDQPWVGSWRHVSSRLGNQEKKAGEGQPIKLLHLTPTHCTRIVYESKTKKLLGVVGGTYSMVDGTYTETIEYADEASRKTAAPDVTLKMAFKAKLESDRLELKTPAMGQEYVEVWERVR